MKTFTVPSTLSDLKKYLPDNIQIFDRDSLFLIPPQNLPSLSIKTTLYIRPGNRVVLTGRSLFVF